jgi:dsRNA-specific ribonuclease
MSNFTFPCASVNGLTTNQKREAIKALRASLLADREASKTSKVIKAQLKQEAAALKHATAVAKAEARLQKLLSKSVGAVGAKAVKANKRPSKASVYTAEALEANAIAAALVAKRKTA